MATILLVDDELILRQLFQTVLEHEGHTILTAGNGREALERMREQTPDLVLLDMSMPQMDGLTFLRLVRANNEWADVPVVIVSAVADKRQISDAGSLGVRDYLLKAGFSLAVLRSRLGKYLETAVDENDEEGEDEDQGEGDEVVDEEQSEDEGSEEADAEEKAPDEDGPVDLKAAGMLVE